MHSDWNENADAGTLADAAFGAGARVAVLAAASPLDGPSVFVNGPAEPAVPARSTVSLRSDDAGRNVLVVFEGGDARRPIIIGVMQDSPVAGAEAASNAGSRRDVRIDGARVSLEAGQELRLRCGEASITLRADGRVVIKGMEIVSRARGTHKVKGASVLIN